jgi:sulfatase maturation enzyme AslB (radical SAM superfamily)
MRQKDPSKCWDSVCSVTPSNSPFFQSLHKSSDREDKQYTGKHEFSKSETPWPSITTRDCPVFHCCGGGCYEQCNSAGGGFRHLEHPKLWDSSQEQSSMNSRYKTGNDGQGLQKFFELERKLWHHRLPWGRSSEHRKLQADKTNLSRIR